ncbi:iron reductase, partial [Salmonella enterica subsp. enterica serovar Newport str. S09097]
DINAKLIWSNTGYLINWYLTEMKPLLGEALLATLRQRCFLKSSYPTVRITRCGGPS